MTSEERNKGLANQPGMAPIENEDEGMEINLVELLLRLLEKWKIIAASAMAGVLVFGLVTAFFIKPVYESTAKLYVLNATNSLVNLSELQISNYLTADYQQVFINHEVHDRVMEKLGLDTEKDQLPGKVSVSNPSNTRILYVKVESHSAQDAYILANTYAQVAQEFIPEKMGGNPPTMFEEAELSVKPVSPSMPKNLVLGFLLGAVIASAVIVVLFIMDDRIRTKEDIEKHLAIPTLGMMPMGDQAADSSKKGKKGIRGNGGKNARKGRKRA